MSWVLDDGSGSNSTSTPQTTTIDITAINDAPTLTGTSLSVDFTEDTTVALSPDVTVSDVDNVNLASATVAIVGGTFAGDGDVLGFSTAGTSITASYNSSTETLTLTGSDTLDNYRQVLDSVSFATGDNPDDFGANANKTRTVTWVLDDGGLTNDLSTAQTTTINVTATNDPPTVSAAASVGYTVGATITISPSLSVSDPDNLTLASATVAITGGTFAASAVDVGSRDLCHRLARGNLRSNDAGAEVLTLTNSATLADYQSVLDLVTFTTGADPNNGGANPTRTVTWLANDGATDGSTTTTIDIAHIAPTLSTSASASYSEGQIPGSHASSPAEPKTRRPCSASPSRN